MAQVSKKFVASDIEKRMFVEFSQFFNYSLTDSNAAVVLSEFFTPTEKKYLAKRFMIAYFLIKEVDWETIKDLLKVSQSTINSVAQRLDSSEGYLKEKLAKFAKKKEPIQDGPFGGFLSALAESRKGYNAYQNKLHRQEHENS